METNLLSDVLGAIISSISIPYILSVNLLVYTIIKSWDGVNGERPVLSIAKRIITLCTGGIMFAVFYFIKISNAEVLILSMILTPFTYKYIMKYILKTFGIQYKTTDITNI